jgi:hypothetical protein
LRINHDIIFIDGKGQSFNALVKSSRDDGHGEPLVTLIYNAPPTGEPIELIDVPHISHPSRKENNPELPSYPLHAWKHEDEEHLEIPADHPVHDHYNEQPTRDSEGNIVPKRRPLHEAHIAAHRAKKAEVTEGTTTGVTSDGRAKAHVVMGARGADLPASTAATLESYAQIGHPAHPETVKFPFACESCGASVTRTASHHGGKQWEAKIDPNATTPSTSWVEHACKQEDIDAFRKKIKDAKKPAVVEPSAAERLAAGEQLAPEPTLLQKIEHVVEKAEEAVAEAIEGKPEPDVIAELEKAPPAPSETDNKPEDAA